MSNKMSGKTLEEEVKVMQKHFGGLVQMVKALKVNVEALENKIDKKVNAEIKEIVDAQSVIDDILVANTVALKRIDKEIQDIVVKQDIADENKSETDDDRMNHVEKKTVKKCRYFNAGFCKYSKKGCRFLHPKDICKEYLDYHEM